MILANLKERKKERKEEHQRNGNIYPIPFRTKSRRTMTGDGHRIRDDVSVKMLNRHVNTISRWHTSVRHFDEGRVNATRVHYALRSTREPRPRCVSTLLRVCRAAVFHRGEFGTERVEGTCERRILINCLLWMRKRGLGRIVDIFSRDSVRLFEELIQFTEFSRDVFQLFTFRSYFYYMILLYDTKFLCKENIQI